jgi:hypothetical protein
VVQDALDLPSNQVVEPHHLEPPSLEEEPGRESYTDLPIIKDERAMVGPYPGHRRKQAQREGRLLGGGNKHPVKHRSDG